MNEFISPKVLTTTAFLIGLTLIDELDSTEQNALGNWFMLIGQTLCTNGSENFKRDWKKHITNDMNQDNTIRMLNKAREVINSKINDIK